MDIYLKLLRNGSTAPRKQEPISLGAAALMGALPAVGNVVSGLFGASAQSSANAAQIEIANKQMQWQSEENQKQRDYQTEMWNKNNAYNTPAMMMQRYRQAGLNPYLVSGESGQGQASMASAPGMQGAPNMPTINPVNYASGLAGAGAGLSSALGMFLQGQQVESNIDLQRSQTIQNFLNSSLEAYKVGGRSLFNQFTKMFAPALQNSDMDTGWFANRARSEIYNMDMDSLNKELQYELARKYSPQQLQTNIESAQQGIRESVARIAKMASDTAVNDATIDKIAQECVTEIAKQFNLRAQGNYYLADAQTVNALRSYVVDTAKSTAEMYGFNAQTARADFESQEGIRGFKTSTGGKEQLTHIFTQGLKGEQTTADLNSNLGYRLVDAFTTQVGKIVKIGVTGPISGSPSRPSNPIGFAIGM